MISEYRQHHGARCQGAPQLNFMREAPTQWMSHAHTGRQMEHRGAPIISTMLAVADAASAAAWYRSALGAEELWNLGSVIGLSIGGAPFFLGEPSDNGWDYPARLGMPSVRIEVFCDDPDGFIRQAVAAGATG